MSQQTFPDPAQTSTTSADVVLIGGGIMSVTLGALIRQLEPTWRIHLYERLEDLALESSGPWNNAGTGHAALCELNYTPQRPDGSVDITKAVKISDEFQLSREFWNFLMDTGKLPAQDAFLAATPHMTFVHGKDNVAYLKARYDALAAHPHFFDLEFSQDPAVITQWAPLLTLDRYGDEPIAATRAAHGTDVNFGRLTTALGEYLGQAGVEIHTNHEVTGLRQRQDKTWDVQVKNLGWNATDRRSTVNAKFVFVGAGGAALSLLQKARLPEIKGYGGFPISGVFLRTTNPRLVAQHKAKVYGKASVGSPPMSVPHLDTRVVDGQESLLFGPYAGFSTKFLKSGSYLDLFKSIRPHNLWTMISVALDNMSLTKYLMTEVTKTKLAKFRTLKQFMPSADPKDWEFITAGQRVQVMKTKPGSKSGVLEFGTELVTAQDGSIAGLLGASPGASTAVAAMLTLLKDCYPQHFDTWQARLETILPSLSVSNADSLLLDFQTLGAGKGHEQY